MDKCGFLQGVAYDTGGADIKTGGNMPGMNRYVSHVNVAN